MLHLIIGDNQPLIDDQITLIKKTFKQISFQTFSSQSTLDDIQHAIQSCDMFTPVIGLLIKQPKWLGKSTKSNATQLTEILKMIDEFNFPTIIITSSIDKRSAHYKCFKKFNCIEAQCPAFKDWEHQKIHDWIQKFCSQHSITIDKIATQHIINAYGTSLGIIKQELLKVITSIFPNTQITAQDVERSSGNTVGYYSQLSTEIKRGNPNGIHQCISTLMKLREDPFKIFNQCCFLINQLIPVYLGIREGLTTDAIAKTLGKHPFFVKQLWNDIKQNPLLPYSRKIYTFLATVDENIKSGQLSGAQALIQLSTQLITIQK